MEMTTNALSWFEIPAADFERARAFYSRIFDFDMPAMPMGGTMMGSRGGFSRGTISHRPRYVAVRGKPMTLALRASVLLARSALGSVVLRLARADELRLEAAARLRRS